MLLIQNLKLPVGAGPDDLKRAAASALCVSPSDILDLSLRRQSIDARKKSGVHLVCTAAATLNNKEEEAILRRALKGVSRLEDAPHVPPTAGRALPHPPVVVGMGPAGLSAALPGGYPNWRTLPISRPRRAALSSTLPWWWAWARRACSPR